MRDLAHPPTHPRHGTNSRMQTYNTNMNTMLYNRVKPYLAVIFLQIASAGLAILAKTALSQGMNHYTFSVYRNAIAAAVLAPFAIIFEREARPQMSYSMFFKIMLLGLLEPVIDQNLYYIGMKYTTASFATAMSNVLPAMTFLMAWIFRLEPVNIREIHGQGKIVGTLVTVSGAMIMTLIEGPPIELPWTKGARLHKQSTSPRIPQNNIKGSLMIISGCCCWASFYILQAVILKSYPAELSLAALIGMLGSMQGAILTLLVERNNTAVWSLHWDAKLLASIYGGVICSGLGYYVTGVIIKQRGPVFITAFSPLSMVIVTLVSSLILAEPLDLGRVLGAIVIVVGLYLVIWGKSNDRSSSETRGHQIVPLDQQLAEMNESKRTAARDLGRV